MDKSRGTYNCFTPENDCVEKGKCVDMTAAFAKVVADEMIDEMMIGYALTGVEPVSTTMAAATHVKHDTASASAKGNATFVSDKRHASSATTASTKPRATANGSKGEATGVVGEVVAGLEARQCLSTNGELFVFLCVDMVLTFDSTMLSMEEQVLQRQLLEGLDTWWSSHVRLSCDVGVGLCSGLQLV